MKKVPIKDFNVESREKAIEIVENINKKDNQIYFITDGETDYFVLEEESYPLLQSYLNRDSLSALKEKYSMLEKRVAEIEQKIGGVKESEPKQEAVEITHEVGVQEPEHIIEEEEKYEPLRFKQAEKPGEQKSGKYFFKTEQFYCGRCNEPVSVDVPYEKDEKGNLKLANIERIECPKCHSTIYKAKTGKNKILRAFQYVLALISVISFFLFSKAMFLNGKTFAQMLTSPEFITIIVCLIFVAVTELVGKKRGAKQTF